MKNKRFIAFYVVVVLLLLVTTVTYARYVYTDSTSGTIATAQNYYCESEGITSLSECLIRSDSQQDYDSAIATIENRTSNYIDYSSVNTIEPTNIYTSTTTTYNYSTTSSSSMASSTHSTFYYVTESEIFGTDGYTASNITFDSSSGYYQMSNTKTGSIDDVITTEGSGEYIYICGDNLTSATITTTKCSTLYIIYSYTTTTTTSQTTYYFKSGVKLTYNVGDTSNSNPGLYVTSDEYSYDEDGDDINDTNLTYYYRGNVTNNWVSFAGYLWRVVRINGNGTIRMIYSGIDDGSTGSSHTGSNAAITTSTGSKTATFAAKSSVTGVTYRYGATYVGYMYNPEMILDTTPDRTLKTEGGSYNVSSFPTFNNITSTTKYYFFDSSSFDLDSNCSVSGETCTFTCTNYNSSTGTGDNCIYTTWADIVGDSDNYDTSSTNSTSSYYYYTSDYKYTCWSYATTSTSGTTVKVSCPVVSEILGVAKSTAYSSGINESQANVRYHGLFSDSYETAIENVEDSNAKFELEYWYENNILGTEYEDYLSNEIYCGDRSYTSGNGYNFDTFATTLYGAYYRNSNNKSPSLVCTNTNDSYTAAGNSNGNEVLSYPIGLITADEVALAGGVTGSFNYKYYLYTGAIYWTMSPSYFLVNSAHVRVWLVNSAGSLGYSIVSDAYGLRPVINLVSETLYVSGNGTEESPYVIALPSQ